MNNKEEKVILYSTEVCPRCKIIKQKLKQKGIEYIEVRDLEELIEKGFSTVPMLKVGNEFMDFYKGNKWINDNE